MEPSPHLYRKQGLELGRDEATLDRAVAVAAEVESAGAEPVFTLAHLAQRCGVSSRYLRAVVDRRSDPYIAIAKPKRSGETRSLFCPEPLLMDAQRWILAHMLTACRVHDASYAYRTGRSAVMCASQHVGARSIIKLDLHDFFDHVREPQVYELLRKVGYPELLAFQVARLCTRTALAGESHYRGPHPTAFPGYLPQGAPTSGLLANAAMFGLDAQFRTYAQDLGLTYTRYSDDLVFSSAGDVSKRDARRFIHRVDAALAARKLERHKAKTRIVTAGGRKIVLGLLIDHDRLLLTSRFKRRLETHVRGVTKFGLPAHARFRNFDSILSMVNHVDGLIAYAKSVEPEFGASIRHRWDEALRLSGYPLQLDG